MREIYLEVKQHYTDLDVIKERKAVDSTQAVLKIAAQFYIDKLFAEPKKATLSAGVHSGDIKVEANGATELEPSALENLVKGHVVSTLCAEVTLKVTDKTGSYHDLKFVDSRYNTIRIVYEQKS